MHKCECNYITLSSNKNYMRTVVVVILENYKNFWKTYVFRFQLKQPFYKVTQKDCWKQFLFIELSLKGAGTRDLIWLKVVSLERSWWVGLTEDL